MASSHEKDKNILLVRGEPNEHDVQNVELMELIAQRLKLQTIRFTGPEYAEFILKAAETEADQPSVPNPTSKPAPKVSEIQRRGDFLVRETFDDFNHSWLNNDEGSQTVGRAFNDLVDTRPTRERQQWERGRHGGRYVEIGTPRPNPALTVKLRSDVGIEAYVPDYGSASPHSFRTAAYAIEAGSLVDLASGGATLPANTAPAREFISKLIVQLSTQISS